MADAAPAPAAADLTGITTADEALHALESVDGNAKAGLLPKGALQTRTDFGAPGYGGPCPPEGHGPHRYIFTVFAVDVESLDVTADNSGAVFGFNLHFHTLAKASITATYENQG